MTREPAEPARPMQESDWHEPEKQPATIEAAIALPSFDQLYALYFRFTWRVLSHLGVPRPFLDDAVQDVWFIVHRRVSTFDGNADVRTWLFAIATNVARNRQRRETRRAKAPPPVHLHQQSPLADPELVHAGHEAWQFVRSFLDTLDEQRRAIFVCNLLEHMSAVETAEATGLDVKVVYKRVRSLRLAFKAWLERDSGTGAPP